MGGEFSLCLNQSLLSTNQTFLFTQKTTKKINRWKQRKREMKNREFGKCSGGN
jgi:hypothetical protein